VWIECALGDAVTFQRGHDLPKTQMTEGLYPVAGSNGIIGYHDAFTTEANGITIGRSGNIGTPHYYKTNYWAHNTVLYVKDFKGNFQKFIYYFLKTLDFTQFNTGSAVPSLNRNHIHELAISIPKDIAEQKAITSVLSSLDDKIDLLHRQNLTLEAMAETLFRQWFVEEAEINNGKQLLLGDVIETISTTHSFNSDQIVFLNTSDIYLGDVLNHDYKSVNHLPGQAKKSIKKDDILFSEIRPANGRYAYIDFEANDYVVSTKLMVLRSKGIINQPFVYFYLTNKKTIEWLQTLAEARSGTFPQITFDQLRDLIINVPSNEILHSVSKACDGWLKKIKFNYAQILTLEKLRDTLLPKLMSGEVKVKL
jgi:type I restriction enzyme S subunit